MTAPGPWRGTVLLRRADAGAAERVLRALGPEAAREVPRTRARLDRPDPRSVRITIEARDTGALRAALNTYLGWITLGERTEAAARAAPAPSGP
jgi:tRNA threonylcarbamoyladenosine modification (KEOPS) complex  Pcc1 subunit